MKIAIDARFIGPQGTGLGKYTEKLIENLNILDHRNQYFVLLKKDNWDFLKLNSQNFQKVLADVNWYSLKEQLEIPKILNFINPDIVHVPHFNVPIRINRKFIVTIHDLIHHQFSQESATTRNPLIFKLKRGAYKYTIQKAVKNSQKIIVPSSFVKNELIKTFNVNPQKIVVTYEAAEEEYFKLKKTTKLNQILYVGNVYPHKNIYKLIDSLNFLENTKLVLVCPRDIFWRRLNQHINKNNLSDRIIVHGYLDVNKLKNIFADSKAYVFPSLAEGFGIPGLNAMASGLPLIASDIPVFHEIYKDAALYFNPQDPKDIAEKIKSILKSTDLQNNLIKKGNIQVKKYSWQKMAQETLKIYESI